MEILTRVDASTPDALPAREFYHCAYSELAAETVTHDVESSSGSRSETRVPPRGTSSTAKVPPITAIIAL